MNVSESETSEGSESFGVIVREKDNRRGREEKSKVKGVFTVILVKEGKSLLGPNG